MAPLCLSGRGCGDDPMRELYVEYADIASSDDFSGKIKARLSALSVFAESQGLTGYAALDGLRRLKTDLSLELRNITRFSLFYGFVFFICRERGQKSLDVSTAVHAWNLSMVGRFWLLDQWCTFVQKHQRHAISEDTWRQLLEFSQSVHEDLSNYDPAGAWPVLVDDFVASLCRERTWSGCNLDIYAIKEGQTAAAFGRSNTGPIAPLEAPSSTLMSALNATPSKRRRPGNEGIEVESVDCIAQRLAEMSSSSLSCKRLRSSVDASQVTSGGASQDTLMPMDLPEESAVVWTTPIDNKHGTSQQHMICSNVKFVDMFHSSHAAVLTSLGGHSFGPGCRSP